MTSPVPSVIAGFHLVEQNKTHDPTIEKWTATRDGAISEIFILPTELKQHVTGLPNLVGFSKVDVLESDERVVVAIPGQIVTTASKLFESFGPTYTACFAWHISDLLSVLHQSGQAHNWLHPDSIGINHRGQLEIRPAFGAFLKSDPDDASTAIATDCWQMGHVLERMGVTERLDNRLALLTNGLRQELSRLRIQPATAIRQSLSVVLARNSTWEERFVSELGPEWALNQRTFREHSIIPHRLDSELKVKARHADSTADMIDLWGNPFSSTEVKDASSGQALLREAFASQTLSGVNPTSKKTVSDEAEIFMEGPSSLQIDLPVDSLQVPILSGTINRVQSIQEIGLDEDLSISSLMGMRSIIEENDFVDSFGLRPVVETVEPSDTTIDEVVVDDPTEKPSNDIQPVVEVSDVAVLEVNEITLIEPTPVLDVISETEPVLQADEPFDNVSEELVESNVIPDAVEPMDDIASEANALEVEQSDDDDQQEMASEPLQPQQVEEAETALTEQVEEQDDLAIIDKPLIVSSEIFEQEYVPVPEEEAIADIQADTGAFESVEAEEAIELASIESASAAELPKVLLGGIPLIPIVEEVSEDPEVTGAILDTEASDILVDDNPFDYGDEPGDEDFVVSLNAAVSINSGDELDVEEPLAAVDFPSIEEVRSQDASFSGNLDDLFNASQPEPELSPITSQNQSFDSLPGSAVEPKWTGSTAFDNLTDSENALGDEKYNMEQAQLGDVDAVLSESIRDYSEAEQKGSVWGMLLVATIVVVFGVVYLVNPTSDSADSVTPEPSMTVDMTGSAVEAAPKANMVSIQTDPPQGRVYIDNTEVGVAPVEWESTEGSLFMVCVDWGSNPICRRVPKSDLTTEYTFRQVLTP